MPKRKGCGLHPELTVTQVVLVVSLLLVTVLLVLTGTAIPVALGLVAAITAIAAAACRMLTTGALVGTSYWGHPSGRQVMSGSAAWELTRNGDGAA